MLVAANNITGSLGLPYKRTINLVNDAFDYVRDTNGEKTGEKVYNSKSSILQKNGINPNFKNKLKIIT